MSTKSKSNSKLNITVKITDKHKELINQCFKVNLIRPNEYGAIRDYLMEQELASRKIKHKDKWFGCYNFFHPFNENNETASVYQALKQQKFCSINLAQYQVHDLKNANKFYLQTYSLRRVADMIKESDDVYVDSDILRNIQWVLNNKEHMYEIVERYSHCLK